jgi:hypothetical protein
MQTIIPLIIVGLFVYLMFSRKGGMGCCGGHSANDSKRHQDKHPGTHPGESGNVIDLKEEDYTILPHKETPPNRRLPM